VLSSLRRSTDNPLPPDLLEWQVRLRRFTMHARNGSPHVGVAPVLCVAQPGLGPGVAMHNVICGLLPATHRLEASTQTFRTLYERHAAQGSRAIYDAGIAHLAGAYDDVADYDPSSITSLLPEKAPAVRALRATPRCALLFYVFDLDDRTEEGKFRCIQVNARAELHDSGPLYDNVWWHNALFHGKVDGHAMVHFRHESSFDTRFGSLDRLDG
jgi:hypothetical protein